MSWPTIAVEIDTAHDPNDPAAPAPTWTAITTYVADEQGSTLLDITRGRNYELATVDPGTCEFPLRNSDGRFDPTNTSSPYYPNLKVMRQMRVRATYNAITYGLFRGNVERWPMEWVDHGLRGRSTPVAIDVTAALAQAELLRPWLGQAQATGATFAYPMGEPSDETQILDALGSGPPGQLKTKNGGSYSLGNELPLGDSALMLSTPSINAGAYAAFPMGSPPVTQFPFTIEGWFKLESDPLNTFGGQTLYFQTATDSASYFDIWLHSVYELGGALAFRVINGGTDASCNTGSWVPAVGPWYHVVAGLGADAHTTFIYINGVDRTNITSNPAARTYQGTQFYSRIGVDHPSTTGLAPGGFLNGELVNFAFYNGKAVSLAEAGDLYAAGYGFVGDTADERIAHVATQVGWTGGTALDAGLSTLSALNDSGSDALGVMQSSAAADGGVVFTDGDGVLTFRGRRAFENPASLYTFGEVTGSSEIPYRDVSFDYDDTYIANDVTVSRPDGAAARETDSASAKSYYRRTLNVELPLADDDQATAAAQHLLAIYKDPHLRVADIEVEPSALSGTLANLAWAACLGLDVGDAVTVKRRPPGLAVISLLCIVQQIRHLVVGGVWRTRFSLTPADTSAYLRWGAASNGTWDQTVWSW